MAGFKSLQCRRCRGKLAKLVLSLSSLCRHTEAASFETWDIEVRMYRDANCFERGDDLLLLDQGCYSNMYSNLTKAYQLKVVNFNTPQTIEWMEYMDDCTTKAMAIPRTFRAGRCERWAGAFWGVLKLRYRSTVCMGDCSQLTTVNQMFYSEKNCNGVPYITFTFPSPGCMKGSAGTQDFSTNESGKYIVHTVYVNDMCNHDILDTYEYVIVARRCYALYEDKVPYSFMWDAAVTSRLIATSASGVRRHRLLDVLSLWWASLVLALLLR